MRIFFSLTNNYLIFVNVVQELFVVWKIIMRVYI